MAHSKARAFDVFLSFSGDDTRYDFVDYLYQHLVLVGNAEILVFKDDNEIQVGDKIGKTILQAIDNSKICIPIISQTYPDRKWCLIELARMMNNVSQSKGTKRIFPIFYKVEPGDIRHRTPRPKNPPSEVELRVFKEALKSVGQIKGWIVHELQRQTQIINEVGEKVMEVLGRKEASQTENPIELDDLTNSLVAPLELPIKMDPMRTCSSPSKVRMRNVIRKESGKSLGGERKDDMNCIKYEQKCVGREREDMKCVRREQERRGTTVGKTSVRRERARQEVHQVGAGGAGDEIRGVQLDRVYSRTGPDYLKISWSWNVFHFLGIGWNSVNSWFQARAHFSLLSHRTGWNPSAPIRTTWNPSAPIRTAWNPSAPAPTPASIPTSWSLLAPAPTPASIPTSWSLLAPAPTPASIPTSWSLLAPAPTPASIPTSWSLLRSESVSPGPNLDRLESVSPSPDPDRF